ncbi:ABC transporter ATP-binding protein [Candidatus Woesearchaeota archaeon]|nr:ABC transporter ATP-binding protein [Candidatus Woesearchaeota archaeon]
MEKKEVSFFQKSKRILQYAKPYWHVIFWLFVLSAVLALLSLVGPYLVKILIDDVIVGQDLQLLFTIMVIFIGIFLLKTIIQVYYNYKTEALEETVVLDVKKELFQHLEHLDLGFLYSKQLGDILVRVDEDVYGIQSFINIIIDGIVMNFLLTLFILIICLHLNWRVTLASLTFFPFYIFAQKYFGEKIKQQKKVVIEKDAALLSFIQEGITSIKAIKEFLLEKLALHRYTTKTRELIKQDLRLNLLSSYSTAIVGFITFTPLLIILWYGSFKVITGALTIGSLMALYTYIGKLFGPISNLGSINVAIQSAFVSVDRVFEFLDTKPKIQDKPNARLLRKVYGGIVLDHVSFGYDKDIVLENISFTIKPGEKIGLVGPSGAGKTTIANLACRFYDPLKGRILLDGIDVRDIQLKSLRKHIGIVSQDIILFNATIKENIKFGNIHASDEQVMEAAKLANIHDFITNLPKGYNTIVGERGVNLSGGEAQRLSIARTILKSPSIIILDEGTSALDSETEQKIQESFDYVTKGKTTIIIAHRLATLKNADKILVLKDKKIVEQGSFSSLIKKQGLFSRYYKLQFKMPIAPKIPVR